MVFWVMLAPGRAAFPGFTPADFPVSRLVQFGSLSFSTERCGTVLRSAAW
jgi:hypothetical protein